MSEEVLLLNDDCLSYIFKLLSVVDLTSCCCVCVKWRDLIDSDVTIWAKRKKELHATNENLAHIKRACKAIERMYNPFSEISYNTTSIQILYDIFEANKLFAAYVLGCNLTDYRVELRFTPLSKICIWCAPKDTLCCRQEYMRKNVPIVMGYCIDDNDVDEFYQLMGKAYQRFMKQCC